jgi:Fe-S-cluster containining protein
MRAKNVIKNLNKQIPSFECIEGCTDCCTFGGNPFWTDWERGKVEDKRHEDEKVCPFVTEQGCGCYQDRPMICRLWGTTEHGPRCPHGRGPVDRLNAAKTKEIVSAWHSLAPKQYLRDRVITIDQYEVG